MPASESSPLRSAAAPVSRGTLQVDVVLNEGEWPDVPRLEGLVAEVAAALMRHPGIELDAASEACVALSSDAAVQVLNATYRGKDKPTNVLSFPAPEGGQTGQPEFLGDVVLALETVIREARDREILFEHHFQHLTLHGLLHLMGYDHETEAEAGEMEAIETAVLGSLGIADPYGESGADALDA